MAPIVALSLIALIAVGGIAFDFAHVAAMDTELQDAADHAALAAATQLDGSDGAQDRATTAAQSLITNKTRFAATDADHDRNVGIATVTFYSAYTSPTSNTAATGDADSNFVQVEVDTRTANYAFTPIVAAFHNSLKAKAVAGVSSAVCGVVPFFICNPVEPVNNTDVHLPPGGVDPGTGVIMAQGGSAVGTRKFRLPRPAREWRQWCRASPRLQCPSRQLPADFRRDHRNWQCPERGSRLPQHAVRFQAGQCFCMQESAVFAIDQCFQGRREDCERMHLELPSA